MEQSEEEAQRHGIKFLLQTECRFFWKAISPQRFINSIRHALFHHLLKACKMMVILHCCILTFIEDMFLEMTRMSTLQMSRIVSMEKKVDMLLASS